MAVPNLYEELKKVLLELKTFLDQNVPVIKPAIVALRQLVPQITDLLNELITLLGKLKTEIQNLNVGTIPGLDKVSAFTGAVKTLLETTKKLLPNEAGAIETIAAAADVVTGLPSVDQLKAEIISLIDAVVAHLNSLKA
jgi:flagellar biosynthesis/type III secretory pathway chaperone